MFNFIKNLLSKKKNNSDKGVDCYNITAKNLTDECQQFDLFVRDTDFEIRYILKYNNDNAARCCR